jgi:hypothetical protein
MPTRVSCRIDPQLTTTHRGWCVARRSVFWSGSSCSISSREGGERPILRLVLVKTFHPAEGDAHSPGEPEDDT